MNCFMFPGQPLSCGVPLPGDGDFAPIAEMVRRVAHLDLEKFAWLDGAEGTDNLKLQLCGVAQSLYHLRLLRRQGMRPGIVAEHSMGIYAALVACGSLPETDAIHLTWMIGSLLARMGKKQQYALGCVIGLTLEPVLALAANNQIHLANHNSSRHFLLSGKREDVVVAMVEATDMGAFTAARTFDYDAPIHTPLIVPLEQEIQEILAQYRFAEPVCPLMNHLDQSYLGAKDIPEFLLRELWLPVYWERTYRALRGRGVRDFFEVGAGDALKKYNRWIEGEIES